MSVTPRQLNRATLDRQLLLRRARIGAVDAVERIVALQAQEPPSPYLALWNRIASFDPQELDRAFTDRVVVKAPLMRMTLHAVHARDYRAFHTAMTGNLRACRLHDRRFKVSGSTIAETDALVPALTGFTARARTSAQVEQFLTDRIGRPAGPVWWALRTYAPLHHAPAGGPWSFGQRNSFLAAPAAPALPTEDDAVQQLLLRYLAAFGPASEQDFGQFTMLRRPIVTAAVRGLTGTLVELTGADGGTLWDVPGGTLPRESAPAPPRLLPMWDSILLAYADRSRVLPEEYRTTVLRRNGDVLPTLLVDGMVAGVWRAVDGGIEATAFRRLDDRTWHGLQSEASSLLRFLADRDPQVYRRHGHWWAKGMPAEEVRLLGA